MRNKTMFLLGFFLLVGEAVSCDDLPALMDAGTGQTISVAAAQTATGQTLAKRNASIDDFGGAASSKKGRCASTAGSPRLICPNKADFKVGQGVLMHGAGASYSGGTPTDIFVKTCGKPSQPNAALAWCSPGTSTANYAIAPLNGDGSIGPVSEEVSTSDSPATINSINPNLIAWKNPGRDSAPAAYVILGHSKSGFRVPIGLQSSRMSYWSDYGADNVFASSTLPVEGWLPQADIVGPRNGWLRGVITSIDGEKITLTTIAGATVAEGALLHDNTDVLASALDTAGKVFIPCGTYIFSGELIEFKAGAAIEGDPSGCSKLSISSGILNLAFLRGVDAHDAVIRDITIDVGGHAQAKTNVIACANCDGALFEKVKLLNIQQFGFGMVGGNGWIIDRSRVTLETPYLSPNQCINVSGRAGVAEATNIKITNNICVGTGIFAWLKDSLVSGNDVSRHCFGSGIAAGNVPWSRNTRYINNNVHDSCSGRDANNDTISCFEVWAPDMEIAGNRAINCYDGGLKLGGARAKVENNTFGDNGGAGIELMSAGSYFKPDESVIQHNNTFDSASGRTQSCGIKAGNYVNIGSLQLHENGFGEATPVCDRPQNGARGRDRAEPKR